jgi:hypothetical protein
MSDRDDAAAAYYEDPENRQLKGPGHKLPRQPGRLTTHVPIRFSAGIIERVKDLAADDGKTVSSWIRDVVEREVLRRERSKTVGIMLTVQWKERTSEPSSDTLSSGEQSVEDLHRLVGLSWRLVEKCSDCFRRERGLVCASVPESRRWVRAVGTGPPVGWASAPPPSVCCFQPCRAAALSRPAFSGQGIM